MWMRVAAMAGLTIGLSILARAGTPADEPGWSDLDAARGNREITTDVGVEIALAKSEYRPLEPIRLSVEARNVSGRPFTISGSAGSTPYRDYRQFRLKVFDGHGNRVSATRFAEWDLKFRGLPAGQSGSSGGGYFNPGDVERGELFANLACDMTSPGEYTILIEFPMRRPRDGGSDQVVALSRPIRVTVLEPRAHLPPSDADRPTDRGRGGGDGRVARIR